MSPLRCGLDTDGEAASAADDAGVFGVGWKKGRWKKRHLLDESGLEGERLSDSIGVGLTSSGGNCGAAPDNVGVGWWVLEETGADRRGEYERRCWFSAVLDWERGRGRGRVGGSVPGGAAV